MTSFQHVSLHINVGHFLGNIRIYVPAELEGEVVAFSIANRMKDRRDLCGFKFPSIDIVHKPIHFWILCLDECKKCAF